MSKRETPGSLIATVASPLKRRVATALIILNFTLLIIALSANLAPSYLHGQLSRWCAFWQVTTGQDYILLPLELTHATRIDEPLVAQVQYDNAADGDWQPIDLPQVGHTEAGLQLQRSRWANMGRLVAWIAEQQPDSEALAAWTVQLVHYAEARSVGTETTVRQIRAVRMLQPHVMSYDEDLSSGGVAPTGEDTEDRVVYLADVIRESNGIIRIVPQQDPSLTSKANRETPNQIDGTVEDDDE